MEKKEILEKAAKSIGKEITWGWLNPDGVLLYKDQPYIGNSPWNPIESNDKAFKLMNFHFMRIERHIRHPYVCVFAGNILDSNYTKVEQYTSDDIDADIRFLITKTAALLWEKSK